MYKYFFHLKTALALIALFPSESTTAQIPTNSTLSSFTQLRASFASPGKRFGSAPLWVWNKDIDSASISFMLQQFKDKAFGGVFIHPRAGLITPYLSDQWLARYRFAVQEGKRIGLDVWIYDENSYPSGFAGGHVPSDMPESFNQGEMLELHKVKSIPDDIGSFFICLKLENDSFIDFSSTRSAEKGRTGDYYLFKKTYYYSSPWYGGFSYVDLMAKGVTQKFIEETIGRYETVIGDEFGKTVPGIFSDEPNIEVQYPGNMRWTPDLFDAFFKKWNYHLETQLPALFEETGNWKKVRHNYYQTLLQLFIDRWSKPFASYTASKKLEWTGHYWEHEWPNVDHGPDNMAMYAWPQRPGIDMLFNQFDENNMNAQFGNIRSVKELASVANQMNKKRTLSETYGGGGWELTFKDMKRLGDWEFVLGINTLNQHLSFMSIKGARKYDYPQSFSYHTPWWPYYTGLNRYFARLSMALSSGEQINHTLIIEPTTTVWMYYKNGIDELTPKVKEIGNRFQQFITRLEKSQVEYDLGSENIIAENGRTSNGRFIVGARSYSTVVLPPGIENLDSRTFSLLSEYAKAGGKIIQFSPLAEIDGNKSKLIDEFYGKKYKNIVGYDSLDRNLIHILSERDCTITQDSGSHGDLYHYRRRTTDGELIFLSNADIDNKASGTLSVDKKNVYLLDLFSGEIFEYPASPKVRGISIHFEMPAAGSRLFFISDEKFTGFKKYSPMQNTGQPVQAITKISPASGNVLTIDFCDLVLGDTVLHDKHVFDGADTVFKHFGFADGNPWNTSVQFNDNTIARDTFTTGRGFTTSYYFNIADDADTDTLKAIVESARLYRVILNGKEILPIPGRWWLDKEFNVFEIGPFVHKGKNTLSLTANPMSVYAEIEPVYILGNFSLKSAKKGWDIIKAVPLQIGSWKKQGMPMYGQEVVYSKNIQVAEGSHFAYRVQLGKWEGTVAVVKVNKQLAGIISLEPYTCDITAYLHNGENNIEVEVIGSLKNVLGPHHNHPKKGLVSPWHWRYVKGYPPGDDYDLFDYGLMEDFNIMKQTAKN